jgi:hypothetical protein
MPRTREQILEERRRLKLEYGKLFESIAKILFDADPIGIGFENNPDEYYPEVGTILPRLNSCHEEGDVVRVVHEEFVRWFDTATAGRREIYRKIAGEVWTLWLQKRDLSRFER